jgi:cell fate (sporulation/competence/biofilm development) regulator YmcA (YheA/YmcA/DUF963 family)
MVGIDHIPIIDEFKEKIEDQMKLEGCENTN